MYHNKTKIKTKVENVQVLSFYYVLYICYLYANYKDSKRQYILIQIVVDNRKWLRCWDLLEATYYTPLASTMRKQYSLSTTPLKHRILNRNNLCSFNTQHKRPLGVYKTTSKKLESSLVFIQFCPYLLKYHIKKISPGIFYLEILQTFNQPQK